MVINAVAELLNAQTSKGVAPNDRLQTSIEKPFIRNTRKQASTEQQMANIEVNFVFFLQPIFVSFLMSEHFESKLKK